MHSFEKRIVVKEKDLDDLRHVNNAVYVHWIQEVAGEHWMQLFPNSTIEQAYWVVLEHSIKYRHSAILGDNLLVKTYVESPRGLRFPRIVEFSKDGKLVVESRTDWCLIDAITKRPKRVSEEILKKFELV